MKIGIISDIHSNIAGLRSALARLTEHGVEHILCAGDLVDGGQNGDEVVALIRANDIYCVAGNHDQDARAEQAALRNRNFSPERSAQILLSDATLNYLSTLPKRLTLHYEDRSVCLAHGVPWSNRTYLWPESELGLFERVVADAEADVVVLGHTHMPMCRFIGDSLIINAGSLDENRRDARQSYAVLDVTGFSAIIYDLNTDKPIRTCGVT